MARLSLAFAFLALPCLGNWAFSHPQDLALRSLSSLERELASPSLSDAAWRSRVHALLLSLEHADQDKVYEGWAALASSNSDRDRANLVLYTRRHNITMTSFDAIESAGPEELLERALATWGKSDLSAAKLLLSEAVRRFPEDARFAQNLLWLEPQSLREWQLQGDARATALSLLAARHAFR